MAFAQPVTLEFTLTVIFGGPPTYDRTWYLQISLPCDVQFTPVLCLCLLYYYTYQLGSADFEYTVCFVLLVSGAVWTFRSYLDFLLGALLGFPQSKISLPNCLDNHTIAESRIFGILWPTVDVLQYDGPRTHYVICVFPTYVVNWHSICQELEQMDTHSPCIYMHTLIGLSCVCKIKVC